MRFNLILMITRIIIFALLIVSTVFDYWTKELKDQQIKTQQRTIEVLTRRDP